VTKVLLLVLFLTPAFAQTDRLAASDPELTGPQAGAASDKTPAASDQDKPGAAADRDKPPENAQGQSRDRSVIQPKPAGEAIKPKDYSDATGMWHPFTRMGGYVLMDQKGIFTSPFHTAKKDAKWWVIFGAGTGGLIAADKYISKNAPNARWLQTMGNDVSYLGEAYTLLPIAAGLYFGGTALHSDHFRETGLLSFESLADVTILELALKSVFDRQRPTEGHGNGEFEASTGPRYNSSFPSGHAIETFALASVLAHEYPHKRWVKILAYTYAGGVVGARLAANKHFPGDVLAGGAMGWFVGDYVYGKRHNPALDKKPTLKQQIVDHVRIGPAYPTMAAN